MKNIYIPSIAVSTVLLIYTLLAFFNVLVVAVKAIFILSPLLMIWLVIKILKDGKGSSYTFEQRFYEDYGYKPVYEKKSITDHNNLQGSFQDNVS